MEKHKKSAIILSTQILYMQKTKKDQPSKAQMPFLQIDTANEIKLHVSILCDHHKSSV